MRITLITVGKIKEKYFTDAIAEYQKRLSRYCKLEILEVADEKTPDGASAAIEEQIKEKEAERVRKVLKDSAYTIALAIDGKQIWLSPRIPRPWIFSAKFSDVICFPSIARAIV